MFRFGRVAAVLFFVTAAMLIFVSGSAAMYFGLPPADFLAKAFGEGRTWVKHETAPAPVSTIDLAQAEVTIDRPEETFEGYTLYTSTHGAEATLLDMQGRVVHRWHDPATPGSEQVGGLEAAKPIHWERCHVFLNGDLLAMSGKSNSPYGESLAKFDKDSRLLWTYNAQVHHDFDVGEDGRIYVLTEKPRVRAPLGLDSIPSEYIADYLVVLSPEGKELETVPLLEAFRDSAYFLAFLSEVETDGNSSLPSSIRPHHQALPSGIPQPGDHMMPPGGPQPHGNMLQSTGQSRKVGMFGRGDILHTNSVKVLNPSLAPRYPLFKSGQVLLSLRSSSLIAVLDIPTHSIVWAARGVWQSQHDARFLDNGHLMLFDNTGSSRGSRVVEYDPVTQAIPWSFSGWKISTPFRGTNQRLANGNTLVVDPVGPRIIELAKDQQVVWQWGCAQATGPHNSSDGSESLCITGAWRFAPNELPFLKEKSDVHPR